MIKGFQKYRKSLVASHSALQIMVRMCRHLGVTTLEYMLLMLLFILNYIYADIIQFPPSLYP